MALQKLNGSNRSDAFELLAGNQAGVDERGCLVIQTPYLSEPVVTNDRVQLIDQKQFLWLGRIDHVINSAGLKIQAEEVEAAVANAFNATNTHRRFMVTGLPDPSFGETVAVIIEGDPLEDLTSQKIKDHLSLYLPRFKQPKVFLYLETFPETLSQKIDVIKIKSLLGS